MFITPAYAQTAGGAGEALFGILPFILIFVIMYLFILRPQRQKMKQHQEMIANVRRGDTVVMAGGLIGKVAKVIDDSEIQLEIGEGVKVRAFRPMIHEVRSKGEPVSAE
ncbi:MAG: preprotein translocase subunit YajC [Rhizobiales bacterium]|nr:preprotein translocase subunit YajC [Hyphomicrobiales bacterium]